MVVGDFFFRLAFSGVVAGLLAAEPLLVGAFDFFWRLACSVDLVGEDLFLPF